MPNRVEAPPRRVKLPRSEDERRIMGKLLGAHPNATSAIFDPTHGITLLVKDEQTYTALLKELTQP